MSRLAAGASKCRALLPRSALLRLCVLGLISALLVSIALKLFWPTMTAFAQTPSRSGTVELPWSFEETTAGNVLTVTTQHQWLKPSRWQIIPDDRLTYITVNGQTVPLDGIRPESLTDYTNGFEIDLGAFMKRGTNTIVIGVDNLGGGAGGLTLRPLFGAWRWSAVGLCFLPLLIGLGGAFRLRASQVILIALSLTVLCAYWAATPWQVRTHDAVGWDGHIGYVQYVARELAIPRPDAGWTYYHPPLYYILGAIAWRWAEFMGLPGPETLQALALALWLVFVVSSAGALRIALRNRPSVALVATLLLAFWPAGIVHSIRLGNDAAFYAASGIVTWYAIRWWKTRRRDMLLGMAISGALALLCKSNAIALVGGCGMLVLLNALRTRNRRAVIDLCLYSSIAGSGLAASFAVRIYYYSQGKIANWLIANGNFLNDGLRVPVNIKSFLPLDIPTFLVNPFISAWDDATGRANFWNYLLRTGLFGQVDFPGEAQKVLAIMLGAILLLLVCAGLGLLIRAAKPRRMWRHLPWSLFAVFWIAALMALRIQMPYSCSNDARYVMPLIVPALIWWGLAGRFSRLLMFCMVPLSAIFFFML
ncbi:MAG TPA: glycosyltransferase family 39 protein [Rhodocyclaceae bacterium]|nr:glycosyltransferase family 39 protein [Rhodocyclaceae bacterium]